MLAEGFSNRLETPSGRVRTSSPELGGTDPAEARGARDTPVLDGRLVEEADLLVFLRAVVRRVDFAAAGFLRLVVFRVAFLAVFFFFAAFFLAVFVLAAFLVLFFFAAFFFVPFRAVFLAVLPARFPALLRDAGFRAVFLRADMMRWASPSMGRLNRATRA